MIKALAILTLLIGALIGATGCAATSSNDPAELERTWMRGTVYIPKAPGRSES